MNTQLSLAIQERDYWRNKAAHYNAWCFVFGVGFIFAAGVILASLTGR